MTAVPDLAAVEGYGERPRKTRQRLDTLTGIVADTGAGRPYRYAFAIEPSFAQRLVDGGYVEVREEGRHPLGGPAHHIYATDKGRALLACWRGDA